MKPTKEQIEAYKEMAKASPTSMKAMIEENLKATCDKFPGNEDKLDGCIDYLTKCANKILGGKNGEVDNETCYRICRDYFNDELWKNEDEEKAEKEAKLAKAKAAAEKTKMESRKKAPKKTASKAKKVTQDFEKEQLAFLVERIEKLKAKHVAKVIKPEKVITSENFKTKENVNTPEQALAEKMKPCKKAKEALDAWLKKFKPRWRVAV